MAMFDQTAGEGHAADFARAGEIFNWNPRAAGLNGEAVTADVVQLADYDQIVQEPGGATITEAGYLPVTGFSLNGEPVAAAGLNDPGGGGWGAHVRITGTGTAFASPSGAPGGAVYDELSYEIVGFNGLATYGFDDNGAVTGGAISDPVTLVAGSLISGGAKFVPSEAGLTIEGSVSLTVDETAPGFATGRLDTFDIAYVHPPEDYSFVSPTTTRVAAVSGTSGAFAAVELEDPAVFEQPVDWDAIAARVTQNFLETGQWYF
jgi:hypothetical protein